MPQRIIYRSKSDVAPFEFERFKKSLQGYDSNITDDMIKQALTEFEAYNPLHVSCLVEVGVMLISDDEQAKRYGDEHAEWFNMQTKFERLRRITGYLVGTLDRWNDGKKAEEKDRVKHNVSIDQYSPEAKAELEAQKLEYSQMSQF